MNSNLSSSEEITKEFEHLCNLISDLKFTFKDLQNPPIQIVLAILVGNSFKPDELLKDGKIDYNNTEILNRFKFPNMQKLIKETIDQYGIKKFVLNETLNENNAFYTKNSKSNKSDKSGTNEKKTR